MQRPNRIEPERLIGAADAIYRIALSASRTGILPANLLGPRRPPQLDGYIDAEVEEAVVFLARLGLLQLVERDAGSEDSP